MGRDLFIGLGGTGGKSLRILFSKMTEEQRKNSDYVYIDTDKRDITALQSDGIKTIRISNANTVREVANKLGRTDGVWEWLPDNDKQDATFLNSYMNTGASQYRYKSRLCLARFLRDPNNELHKLLVRLSPPGAALKNQLPRVIIVASIAGGTGAGTFIETALYVRKFFRDLSQNVTINGILACPDLFTKLPANDEGNDENQTTSMYANAYAAIRELNAMNLVTSTGATSNDYGKNITLRIDTKSEGKLFDSADPTFHNQPTTRPFDLIYFIDEANRDGGILGSIDQYYAMIADLAYARLYSPLEECIGSRENNELDKHSSAPTAIYGSAGYARIRYPYEEILKYLAERRMLQEIDSRWRYFDDQWTGECESEQDQAVQEGRTWAPDPVLRGRRFVEGLNADFKDEEHSTFKFLKDMVMNSRGRVRTKDFIETIEEAVRTGTVLSGSTDEGGAYSIRTDTAVQNAIRNFETACGGGITTDGSNAIARLETLYKDADVYWPDLCAALREAISGRANRLASAIIPQTPVALEAEEKAKRSFNLRWGLLCKDGKDVHPLAARYLLYRLRDELTTMVGGNAGATRSSFQDQLLDQGRAIRLAFDDEWDDGVDYTVEDEIAALSSIRKDSKRDAAASETLSTYLEQLSSCVNGALSIATTELLRRTYRALLEPLNELIAQYESFFENLEQYRQELERKVAIDSVMHDSNRNQVVFVGASSRVKEYYYLAQPNVTAALENGSAECYAAAGAGVYEALEQRTIRAIQESKIQKRMNVKEEPTERFDSMGGIFGGIIEKYRESLRRNASYLKTDAIGALVHEICAELDLQEGEINETAANATAFREAFRVKIDDLEAKAQPMIRYNKDNDRKYYTAEEADQQLDVSTLYCHFGVSPNSAKHLANYFKSTNASDPLDEFKNFVGTTDIVEDDSFSDYEIFCFCAVHCLQPSQIYHFDELQDGSYYESYKERVHTAIQSGTLSKSPHLDKRWHLKGTMPYISKELESKWRGQVMRAFIFQILTRQIRFTIDRDGKECFLSLRNGQTVFIEWPEHSPVLTRNISRLVEYMAEDEILVEESAKALADLIKTCITRNSGYGGSAGLYKTSMTKDLLLKRLRTDAISFYKTSKGEVKMTAEEESIAKEVRLALLKTRSAEDGEEDNEDEEVINLRSTMGSILHIAFLLHMSEERFDEDRDFGEALLKSVLEIIDEYAVGMYGVTQMSGTSKYHREYVDIFNWALDRFMDSWVEQFSREHKIIGKKLDNQTSSDDELLRLVNGVKPTVKTIPTEVQNSEEYNWLNANWTHKAY